MKTLKKHLFLAALFLLTPLAGAATYQGSWENETFGSSGALTIDLTVTATKVSGSFNLDGSVFGGGDPASIAFSTTLDINGSGKFKTLGTAIGDVTGTFLSDGSLTITITNIPGGFLSKTKFTGKFDLSNETFTGTYKVYAFDVLFATGDIEAHVHKAPILKVSRTVNVTGTRKTIEARVTTNVGIKSFKATTASLANITVTGTNPYQIKVTNLIEPEVRVKVTVTNTDGLSTSKTVKFVKSTTAASALKMLR